MSEITICSARDLKYLWRSSLFRPGFRFRPFAVAYVDANEMYSTEVDEKGDRCPNWGTQTFHLVRPIDDDTTLSVVIFDARKDGTNRKIGSASLKLKEVVNDARDGRPARRTLQLRRISGRPRGDVTVEVLITEPGTAQPDGQPRRTNGQPRRRTRNLLRRLFRGLREFLDLDTGLTAADVLNDIMQDDEGDDEEGILD